MCVCLCCEVSKPGLRPAKTGALRVCLDHGDVGVMGFAAGLRDLSQHPVTGSAAVYDRKEIWESPQIPQGVEWPCSSGANEIVIRHGQTVGTSFRHT